MIKIFDTLLSKFKKTPKPGFETVTLHNGVEVTYMIPPRNYYFDTTEVLKSDQAKLGFFDFHNQGPILEYIPNDEPTR